MKPCQECGTAIPNQQAVCENCQHSSPKKSTSDSLPATSKPKHRVTTFHLTLFLLEILITAVIVGIPLGAICSFVALFFFPNWQAVGYGFTAGFLGGILFGLLRAFLFSQSIRKPLR